MPVFTVVLVVGSGSQSLIFLQTRWAYSVHSVARNLDVNCLDRTSVACNPCTHIWLAVAGLQPNHGFVCQDATQTLRNGLSDLLGPRLCGSFTSLSPQLNILDRSKSSNSMTQAVEAKLPFAVRMSSKRVRVRSMPREVTTNAIAFSSRRIRHIREIFQARI